ncbi:hypothetical protein U3A58_20705 [Algoriphagus sp. C2-6-M1]|uniref:hypothetical protein n=1 Tax=Algoriphagus persicinus TaxID=3108754 RepID=UPI002B391312|nr:hypothetical protein [Algoriphagus sp. C2-6-M1]MEB2782814.1 hypothetical protein [Algoriphagus sp. C2-6-M1]
MIADSLGRQFLMMHKHLIRISVIEDGLGISGKSLYKWVIGKRPLPDKWEKPLYEYLYPMLDPENEIHMKTFQIDRVVVLEEHHILPRFKDVKKEQLRRFHFSEQYTAGADVVYFRFINRTLRESYISIYSAYIKDSW